MTMLTFRPGVMRFWFGVAFVSIGVVTAALIFGTSLFIEAPKPSMPADMRSTALWIAVGGTAARRAAALRGIGVPVVEVDRDLEVDAGRG